MRLNFSHAIAASAMSLMLVFASCTKNKAVDAASIASSQDIAVINLNVEDIAVNAGCKIENGQIVLSEKYQAAITDQDFKEILKAKGVDLKNILICASQESQLAVLTLTDAKAFNEWLQENEPTQPVEKDGYTIYSSGDHAWVVKDNVAYVIPDVKNGNPVKAIEDRMAIAKKSPLYPSQVEKLGKDNTANIIFNTAKMMEFAAENGGANVSYNEILCKTMGYDPELLKDAYSYLEIELEGNELESEAKMYDKNGKEIESAIKMPKINTALSRYCPSNPLMNFVFTVPGNLDWNAVIDAMVSLYGGYSALGIPRQYVAIAASVLQDIEGTVVFSMSREMLDAINTSAYGMPNFSNPGETNVTLAVQMKKGKAAEYVGQVKSLAVAMLGMMPNSTADGFELMIPQVGLPVNVAAIDDTFIVSLGQINTRGSFVGSSSIYDESLAFVVDLPKGSQFGKNTTLDFSILGYMKSDSKESEGKLKVSDTNMPLLETFINFAQ